MHRYFAQWLCALFAILVDGYVLCLPSTQELCELGVVSGADLTVEAALTKLSFLLGQTHLTVHDVRKVAMV